MIPCVFKNSNKNNNKKMSDYLYLQDIIFGEIKGKVLSIMERENLEYVIIEKK